MYKVECVIINVDSQGLVVMHQPTTRLALFLPSALEAVDPSGIVDAAILVILMDDVLVARMVSAGSSAEKFRKIACFNARFSETAWKKC